jgi:hypothetical protein
MGLTNVYGQLQQQQQPPSAFTDNNQQPRDFSRGHRLPVPFDQPPSMQAGNFSFGPIASIQNNETGQPAWLVTGFWRGNLLSFNETTTGTAAGANASVTTTITQNSANGNNTNNTSNLAVFNADFRMVMLNGSAPHTHVITNFILSDVSPNENGTTTYTGTSTISMREGPLVDVPTAIKVSGEVISIFPDPSVVNHHFGNTPIYGAILPDEYRRGGGGGQYHDDGPPSSP